MQLPKEKFRRRWLKRWRVISNSARRGRLKRRLQWILKYPSAELRLEWRTSGRRSLKNFKIHWRDRKSTRLNSSHLVISYAVFCLKKKTELILYHNHIPEY